MPFRIVRNDITKMDTEAIVNTANAQAVVGPGCDLAVYQAAGYQELLEYRTAKIGHAKEGSVFITPGFLLKAKYIIHAVSPVFRGGSWGEERKLRSCYRKSLQLAEKYEIRSIAFPLIATGSFGYPKEEGMRIAADEIRSFLGQHEMDVYLVVFDEEAAAVGRKADPGLEAYIDRNYVREAEEKEYALFPSGNLTGKSRFEKNRRSESRIPEEEWIENRISEKEPLKSQIKKQNRAAEKRIEEKDFADSSAPPDFKRSSLKACAPEKKASADPHREWEEARSSPFGRQHESRLEERMRHLSDTYSEYLMYLIRERHMENAEVYKRAIVDKKIFSKIKNNADYHPTKLTALCLCIGAKLNLDEARDLLARAGYALSPCDKMDIIFSYFIENKIYDMIELDIQLEEHGLPCIIA